MATNRYFSNFPIINYNSQNAVNITERVIFLNNALSNPYVFYPYTISDNERPDQFANRYYNDPYKSWMVYLGNQIIDPYYGWYMNTDDFNNFITAKYGSTFLAQSKIKYYENNWYQSDNIAVNVYDALPYNLLQYWQPVYNYYNNIITYSRTQSNNIISTNSIRSYNVSNTSFITDEVCNIFFDNNHTGQGQILSINTDENLIFLQHISGSTLSNSTVLITSNCYIYGNQSNVNTTFTTTTNVCDNLNLDEIVYWSPVTYYDYEYNLNESNKNINILDSSYAANVVNSLKGLLS